MYNIPVALNNLLWTSTYILLVVIPRHSEIGKMDVTPILQMRKLRWIGMQKLVTRCIAYKEGSAFLWLTQFYFVIIFY